MIVVVVVDGLEVVAFTVIGMVVVVVGIVGVVNLAVVVLTVGPFLMGQSGHFGKLSKTFRDFFRFLFTVWLVRVVWARMGSCGPLKTERR